MFNKYTIIALVAILNFNSASSMTYLKRFGATMAAGAAVFCSSYWSKPVHCYNWNQEASQNRLFPKDAELSQYPEFAKFATRYRCSSELEAQKDQHFLKGSQIDRIINAERMQRVIQAENLNLLQVPHKCLCRVGDGRYEVLSKSMDFKKNNKKMSLLEIEQLAKLVDQTAYKDWYSAGNIGYTAAGKIGICDTEDRSFADSVWKKRDLIYHLNGLEMQPEARRWLNDQVQVYEKNPEQASLLSSNSGYDPFGINFEKVKQEIDSYRHEPQPRNWYDGFPVFRESMI